MSVEFSIISMKEVISTTDSKDVKRSKLLYAGIKPKEGYEGSIVSILLDIAKKDFFERLDQFKAKDFFDKKKFEEIKMFRDHIFGEKTKTDEFVSLDSITIEYFYENSYLIQEKFKHFLSDNLTNKEYSRLPQTLKLEIFTHIYQNNHKNAYDQFLKYMFKNEKLFIEDYLTGTIDFPKIRNTIKTRELASLRLFVSMVTGPKKEMIVNSFVEILDKFEEQMFLDGIDVNTIDLREEIESYAD